MEAISLKSNAKINLSLDVIRRMGDGYHELEMLMHSIDLGDIITIKKSPKEPPAPALTCDDPMVPTDESNLIIKAANLIYKYYKPDSSVIIHLDKKTPAAAGLGGGSSNAAATLIGLNKIFSLGLTDYEMWRYATLLGADVPFFLKGGCMHCRGIGELLTPVNYPFDSTLLLIKPVAGLSTASVFKSLDIGSMEGRPDTGFLLSAMKNGDSEGFYKGMGNVLMGVSIKMLPIINDIIVSMREYGAKRAMMSGSGPTVFGIFDDPVSAQRALDAISRQFKINENPHGSNDLRGILPGILCSFSGSGVEVL